jgi:hypothetical protein
LASKTNDSASEIDKTAFWWTQNCSICHPGGGPSEYDRDGEKYYNVVTGEFGYEQLGKDAGDVTLDGDYALVNTSNGALSAAPWNVTGVSEPDCMFCHSADRTISEGKNMNWIWRTATLKGGSGLDDGEGNSVPAFAAAPTIGQGWFSTFALKPAVAGKPPVAEDVKVDYAPGVTDETILQATDDTLYVSGLSLTKSPRDYACWGCHLTPDLKKRGREWFNADTDVHYKHFNNLDDGDTTNDIAAGDSTACVVCHPAGRDHDIAKGNAFLGSVANETDYAMNTCRDCHLDGAHPDAPTPPSGTVHSSTHLGVMSCEMCHVPFKTLPAQLVVDNAATGSSIGYNTDAFLSADPLDPDNADKSRWYPSLHPKMDKDNVERLYPAKLLLSIWWGDWDQNQSPGDLSDDIINPIPLWRVRGIVSSAGLSATDDTGDGKAEVNTLAEIKTYMDALKGDDVHGNPVAVNPVLIKGGHVYWDNNGTVESFEYHGTGIKTESSHPFAINHNVRDGSDAFSSCGSCHRQFNSGNDTIVFDRPILVDPYDENGEPVFKTVREISGVDPD